ncbi:DUF4199 domain-containing protein [Tellurirhabdus rosea]|uniref:DUF4199 domain-containing protein n=1 Tax=Tellurirhabdus rosea TaxID=2674997 RepID=UPI00224CEF1E|nr:DUF4199 domain-containing protein [Tellurirhabdus rosea]
MLKEIFGHPLLKWAMISGLITGVLSFGYFLALYALDIMPLGNKRTPDFGINIIMMIATVWYYRRRVGKGLLHLWEGLSICYVLNTVAAIITGWLIYFFVEQIDPSVFTDYLAEIKNLILSRKGQITKEMGAAQYSRVLQDVNKIRPADLITDEVSKKTVLAVLPVLIISLIFRKQDVSFQKQD